MAERTCCRSSDKNFLAPEVQLEVACSIEDRSAYDLVKLSTSAADSATPPSNGIQANAMRFRGGAAPAR